MSIRGIKSSPSLQLSDQHGKNSVGGSGNVGSKAGGGATTTTLGLGNDLSPYTLVFDNSRLEAAYVASQCTEGEQVHLRYALLSLTLCAVNCGLTFGHTYLMGYRSLMLISADILLALHALGMALIWGGCCDKSFPFRHRKSSPNKRDRESDRNNLTSPTARLKRQTSAPVLAIGDALGDACPPFAFKTGKDGENPLFDGAVCGTGGDVETPLQLANYVLTLLVYFLVGTLTIAGVFRAVHAVDVSPALLAGDQIIAGIVQPTHLDGNHNDGINPTPLFGINNNNIRNLNPAATTMTAAILAGNADNALAMMIALSYWGLTMMFGVCQFSNLHFRHLSFLLLLPLLLIYTATEWLVGCGDVARVVFAYFAALFNLALWYYRELQARNAWLLASAVQGWNTYYDLKSAAMPEEDRQYFDA